jgi:hypothetical protein
MITVDFGKETINLPSKITKVVTWYEVTKDQRYGFVYGNDTYSIGIQFLKELTGRTFVVLWEGDLRFLGVSKCHEDDVFVKKLGRRVAFGRAIACRERYYKFNTCKAYTTYKKDTYEVFYKDAKPSHPLPEWMFLSTGIRNPSLVIDKIKKGLLPKDTEELSKRLCVSQEEVKSLLEAMPVD